MRRDYIARLGLGRRLVALFCSIVAFVSLGPLLLTAVFLDLPSTSPGYDCDDSTLNSFLRLDSLGIKAIPVLGNLGEVSETYGASNHVWLWVQVGGLTVALDWGTPWFDRQHYEGYELTYEQLLFFVGQDRLPEGGAVAGRPR